MKGTDLGGKAKNLLILKEIGLKVPDFLVLKYDFFENEILDLPPSKDDIDNFSSKVFKHYKDFFNKRGEKLYSIRSSANIEDGNKNSFAGMFVSFLSIQKDSIAKKAIECFLFAKDKRIEKYMSYRSMSDNIKMNVIVQEMILGDFAGIIFSINPVNKTDEIIIEYSSKAGDTVVSGRVIPTTLIIDRNTENICQQSITKISEDLLPIHIIKKLTDDCLKIEKYFNGHVDIEFVIKDDEIYYLQTRLITTN